jgi:hypothetical protein
MPGEDLAVCQKLVSQGYYLAQVELGDHVGEEVSAWGNQSHKIARPVDRARWRI